MLDATGSQSNQEIESGTGGVNGRYTFEAQESTGNFLLEDGQSRLLWTPGIVTGDGTYSIMQSDCNYVIYDAQGEASLFNTHTNGHGSGCFLNMQTDGNLVVYNSADAELWDTGTNWDSSDVNGDPSALFYGQPITTANGNAELWSPNGEYFLALQQQDGNLVLYEVEGNNDVALWDTGSSGYYGHCVTIPTSGSHAGAIELWSSYSGNTCGGSMTWYSQGSGTGDYNHALVTNAGTLSLQEVTQTGTTYVTSLG